MMITQVEYRSRRRLLAQQLPEGSVAVIPAASEHIRNGDAHYRFRQDSHFYYLTGFNEPDALLIIIAGDKEAHILFNRPRNFAEEQWSGKRLGQEEAVSTLNMTTAYPIASLAEQLPTLFCNQSAIYYAFGRHPLVEKQIMDVLTLLKHQARKGVKVPDKLCDLEPILGALRLIKSDAEIALMRCAAEHTVAAHKEAMKQCKHLNHEYQLEAVLTHTLLTGGCLNMAYTPIVGSGDNACILHYTDNNNPLKQGDLVLIDAGGEYENYASDVTRTFPINGTFSKEQRGVYEWVLKAQQAGIDAIRPGLIWNEVQEIIIRILTQGLCALGILSGSIDKLIASAAYKPFYMHNFGHWLGLDVHDVGAYKINGAWRPLEAGMVLTVEPGIYISPELEHVDERFRGIGIRIEDDVLVTESGHEVLTAALPSDVDAIEALMRG
jgi:Xaa-Pro aminopeptidase